MALSSYARSKGADTPTHQTDSGVSACIGLLPSLPLPADVAVEGQDCTGVTGGRYSHAWFDCARTYHIAVVNVAIVR